MLKGEKTQKFRRPTAGINPSQIISQWMFPECKTIEEKHEKYVIIRTKTVNAISSE